MQEAVLHIDAAPLTDYATAVLEKAGVPPNQARDAAEVLVWANLRGVDTHGVRNLELIYCTMIRDKRIDPAGEFQIRHETPVSARVDGNRGLGLSASCMAMRLAMQKAQQSGIGMVAIANSYHFGAAGYYPWMALQEDMIGVALTARFAAKGTEIGVVPTFAAVPMFSTNPISIAFPTQEEPPYLLDMATSTSPYNRITMYKELGRSVPLGWGMDANGNPATDPNVIRQLLPLGGTREQGGHKGYGLSMMVEVLCAVLSGGWNNHMPEADDAFEGYRQASDAHFLAAFRIDLFQPVDEFKRGMDAMIRALHAAPKAEGQDRVYVPGEIEHEVEQDRRANGIPLPQNVVDTLQALGREFGVPFPQTSKMQMPQSHSTHAHSTHAHSTHAQTEKSP